ncbi:hypothetical protein K1719_027969 [Acacia pycnantha]|nr:hypothetical protein K1719_027969 [Acacia pycnantha]
MGGLCCCFRSVRDDVASEVTSSSSSTIDRRHQHHADPRVLQFFQRFGSKSKSVRPGVAQTRSIEIADQGTWNSSGYHSDSSEECPTCLEYYTDENPKIETECSHHFHLPCILEWYQRSHECPSCRKVLIVKGVIGEGSDLI